MLVAQLRFHLKESTETAEWISHFLHKPIDLPDYNNARYEAKRNYGFVFFSVSYERRHGIVCSTINEHNQQVIANNDREQSS